MPKISIIIPVYNASHYLAECLDSIIAQTFEDIEIICINDGSTDGSLQILKQYQIKDARILIIDQQNQGVSAARNAGLAIAKGAYIGFVDSDDKICADYLTVLYNLINNSDLSICGYNGSKKINYKDGTVNLKTADLKTVTELLDTGLLYSPWAKLYQAEIINKYQIRFQHHINYGEDLLFNLHYLSEITKIAISSKILYDYNVLNFKSLAKVYSLNRFENTNLQICKIQDFLKTLFTDRVNIGIYIKEKLYWNTYDVCFHLQNNFQIMKKEDRIRWIYTIIDFPYFSCKENIKIKPHRLISIFATRHVILIYGYLYIRKMLF